MCGKEFVGKGFVVRSLWGKDSCDVNFLNGWLNQPVIIFSFVLALARCLFPQSSDYPSYKMQLIRNSIYKDKFSNVNSESLIRTIHMDIVCKHDLLQCYMYTIFGLFRP